MESLKIMTMEDIEDILRFENERLPGIGIEKEMAGWHAPWRREALEHYAPQGWSFIKRKGDQVQAWVMCQPVLFFQGWTQTLWVEHIGAENAQEGSEMLEIAYRWARDKHLQKVFFRQDLKFADRVSFAQMNLEGGLSSLTTTKM